MSTAPYFEGDGGQEIPSPPDSAASLAALSWCLRAVAQGWSLDPRERDACLSLLAAGIPGTNAADLAAAVKFLQAPRRLSGRRRDQNRNSREFSSCAAQDYAVRRAAGPPVAP